MSRALGLTTFGDCFLHPKRDYTATACSCGQRLEQCEARSSYSEALTRAGLGSFGTTVPSPPYFAYRRSLGSRPEVLWRFLSRALAKGTFASQERALRSAFPDGFVDGSKYLLRPGLLRSLGADIRVVHMVRDPAVVVHSAATRHDSPHAESKILDRWERYTRLALDVVARTEGVSIRYEDARSDLETGKMPSTVRPLVDCWPRGSGEPHAIGNRSRDSKLRRPDAATEEIDQLRKRHAARLRALCDLDPILEAYR